MAQLAKVSPEQSRILELAQDQLAAEHEKIITTHTKRRKSKRTAAAEVRWRSQRRRVNEDWEAPDKLILPYATNPKLAKPGKIDSAWYPENPWTHADVQRSLERGPVDDGVVERAHKGAPSIGVEPLRLPRWEPLDHIETQYGDEIRCRSLFRSTNVDPRNGDYVFGGEPFRPGPGANDQPRPPPLPPIEHMIGWRLQANERVTYQSLIRQGYEHAQIVAVAIQFGINLPRRGANN